MITVSLLIVSKISSDEADDGGVGDIDDDDDDGDDFNFNFDLDLDLELDFDSNNCKLLQVNPS